MDRLKEHSVKLYATCNSLYNGQALASVSTKIMTNKPKNHLIYEFLQILLPLTMDYGN